MMKTIKLLSRYFLAVVFLFSGFVKGIDPWGSAYKFTDYFNAMGMEWLLWAAFPLGFFLAFAEFTIGVAFLFNICITVSRLTYPPAISLHLKLEEYNKPGF